MAAPGASSHVIWARPIPTDTFMRKEIVTSTAEAPPLGASDWLSLDALARVRLTSEDPRHPIEAALSGSDARGWRAAQPGQQTIWISFDTPRPIQQINLGFEIAEQRTQEFVLSWSADGGVSYGEIVRQQFNFSPGTTREEENYFPHLDAATDLKLAITPDIFGGSAHATLKFLRLR